MNMRRVSRKMTMRISISERRRRRRRRKRRRRKRAEGIESELGIVWNYNYKTYPSVLERTYI